MPFELTDELRRIITAVVADATHRQPEAPTPLAGADKQYGFRFGCDGLMSVPQAREFLGDISKHTLYRKIRAGLIRKGNIGEGGRTVICRRSVIEYIATMES
jgi:hypothetical protein